ncbi:hypothetical protein B0681_09505 [Moraxella porci DSM 25326]|uniref:Transposase n=1 Tax=Moraxella porci DSM 25326 TaxID=573983 RepID=A0A1T0CM85_9GAMM|nr:transposase [Moraxella porci]OOS23423.1 hypothetical protein B0681_09505 [Moraxella porci DSM 25326]
MTKQRKQYSNEFKLEMVKPIEEQNQRVVDVARQICFNGALYAPYALQGKKITMEDLIASGLAGSINGLTFGGKK